MVKPVIVIVGRPNVGKSTLFNRIIGRASAIVEDIPGVTRDRNLCDGRWGDNEFVVVDTGGFYAEAETEIDRQVREQAMFAIEEADLIVHVMDGAEGLSPDDIELAKLIRASGKPALWAVNKIDGPTKEARLYEFYSLGTDALISVSAKTGYNFEEFMEKAISMLPVRSVVAEKEALYPRVAVIGRPNVGKSTLINTLLGKPRMIVSPVAGTTRDAVDSVCTYYGKKYIFIDTAGIRRKARTYPIERFAMLRTLRSIERADVALIVLDAVQGVVADDQKIAGEVLRCQKGAVFLLNKWDLVKEPEADYKRLTAEIKRKIWFFDHAPVLTVSGLEKKRVTKVFPLIDAVIAERKKRISTKDLNEMLRELPPVYSGGKRVKFNYITQVGTEPPAFALFTDRPDALKDEHIRYIEKAIRQRYSFSGTPIRIYRKAKQ